MFGLTLKARQRWAIYFISVSLLVILPGCIHSAEPTEDASGFETLVSDGEALLIDYITEFDADEEINVFIMGRDVSVTGEERAKFAQHINAIAFSSAVVKLYPLDTVFAPGFSFSVKTDAGKSFTFIDEDSVRLNTDAGVVEIQGIPNEACEKVWGKCLGLA
jgi:hypothetical protein